MSPQLVQALKDQAQLVMNASQEMLALSLGAKSKGWKGAHEWMGDFALDLRKHVKNIGKLILDYAEDDYEVPATNEYPAKFPSQYPDAWQMVRKCVKAEQMGWINIGSLAEELGATDIDDYADGFLEKGTPMVKKLNRWNNELEQANGNTAFWKQFDKARRR